jgi:hypothetical protein
MRRASSNFLAALVRRLGASVPRAGRVRGRPKTGIRLGQGVLNRY